MIGKFKEILHYYRKYVSNNYNRKELKKYGLLLQTKSIELFGKT